MNRFEPPPRREYLQRQREEHGRLVFGVFPAQYPREILWAMNVIPVEIWDPPLEVGHANAHLQPYICSVVRLGLELILQGKCDDLDGFLFPHTCDSIQNLASIVYDYLELEIPCYFFYPPKAPYTEASRAYYKGQLADFLARLEKQLGPVNGDALKQSVDKGRRAAVLLRTLYERRARGEVRASNEEFYRVVRQGEFLHPDDFIPLLEAFLEKTSGGVASGSAVILSGIVPNPPEILSLLDRLGLWVADDDLLCCSRRLPGAESLARDPLEEMTEAYFSMPPCCTKASPIGERLDALLDKAEQSSAKGVIFATVKFCEPELFDLPQLIEGLKEKGLAVLAIDTELNQGLSGQLATRLEAFAEMMEA